MVFVLAALAIVGLYVSAKGPQVQGKTSVPTSTSTSLSIRPTVEGRKADKPRVGTDPLSLQKPKVSSDAGKAEKTSKRPEAKNHVEPVEIRSTAPAEKRRGVKAPSIRLPNPEFAVTSKFASYDSGSLGSQPNDSEPPHPKPRSFWPQFFRTQDGTYIIRFADGSSRTVKPGDRSGR